MIKVKEKHPGKEASLSGRFPNLIPKYETNDNTYDPKRPFNYYWGFGTNQKRADAGLMKNYDGYSAYGSITSKDNLLPVLERNWDTPVGDISLKMNTERPGVIARYSANNLGDSILDTLVHAYNRWRTFDKEYNQNSPPVNIPALPGSGWEIFGQRE